MSYISREVRLSKWSDTSRQHHVCCLRLHLSRTWSGCQLSRSTACCCHWFHTSSGKLSRRSKLRSQTWQMVRHRSYFTTLDHGCLHRGRRLDSFVILCSTVTVVYQKTNASMQWRRKKTLISILSRQIHLTKRNSDLKTDRWCVIMAIYTWHKVQGHPSTLHSVTAVGRLKLWSVNHSCDRILCLPCLDSFIFFLGWLVQGVNITPRLP